jgi:hypothetical protein
MRRQKESTEKTEITEQTEILTALQLFSVRSVISVFSVLYLRIPNALNCLTISQFGFSLNSDGKIA